MLEPGDLVTYRHRSGDVRARLVDIVPDVDQTYYALEVTSRTHRAYLAGTELLVPVGSPLLRYRRKSAPKPEPRTACQYGHEYTEANTYYEVGTLRTGVRRCRECLRHHKNKWYARKVGK